MSSPRINQYDTSGKKYDGGWKYDSYLTGRPAKLTLKVFDEAGVFKGTYGNDVINEISFENTINGGLGQLILDTALKIDNFGQGNTIDFNNIIEIYLTDEFNTAKLIYKGYVTAYNPYLKTGKEGVKITCLGIISKLSNDFYRVGDVLTITKNSTDPALIIKAIIDNYRTLEDNPLVNYTGTSIKVTGTKISYTFNQRKHIDAILKTQEFLPYNWYWHLPADGNMIVQQEGQTTHTLSIGQHISELETFKNIETVRNKFIFWNGRDADDPDYIYSVFNDVASQAAYDIRSEQQTDSRVTLQATANVKGNSFINANKDPKTRIRVVVNNTYDIASIEPGDYINIRNIDTSNHVTFPDSLKVVKIRFSVDAVELTLAERGTDIAFDVDRARLIVGARVGSLEQSVAPVPPSALFIANKEWVTDIIFSETDYNTVQWTSGTITFADGTTRSIAAGNTGNMAAATLIYLDDDLSQTVFQTSVGFQNGVGPNKIAVCIAIPAVVGKHPTINPYRAGRGFAWSELDIAVPNLSAINVNAGELTAGIITGLTIRTANANDRVQMDGTNLKVYKNQGGVARLIAAVGFSTAAFLADIDANVDIRGLQISANHVTGVNEAVLIETDGNQEGIILRQPAGAPATGHSIFQDLQATAGTGDAIRTDLYGNQPGYTIATKNNNNAKILLSLSNASVNVNRVGGIALLRVLQTGTGRTVSLESNSATALDVLYISMAHNSNANNAINIIKTSTGAGNAIRAVNSGNSCAFFGQTDDGDIVEINASINDANDIHAIKADLTNIGAGNAYFAHIANAGLERAAGTETTTKHVRVKDSGGNEYYIKIYSVA